MSIPVVISGTTFNIPTQSSNPPWGEDLTSFLEALSTLVNSTTGPSDVLTTNFTVANNQSSTANVTGLFFSTTQVRSAIISYSIYRSSNTPTELSEAGQIYITYKSTAGTWELAQVGVGSSGVSFTITNSGQIQYTSTDIGSGAYVGKMKFNAKSFLQT